MRCPITIAITHDRVTTMTSISPFMGNWLSWKWYSKITFKFFLKLYFTVDYIIINDQVVFDVSDGDCYDLILVQVSQVYVLWYRFMTDL